jgi:hypothetical protein
VNQQIHPGPHLDADQLSTIVEGVESAREREQMLVHLAGCDACREMVFLLRGSVDTPPAATAEPVRSAWRNWLMPMGLAGAALACGITALVYFRVHSTMRERVQQSAVVQPPSRAGGAPPPSETHLQTQAGPSIQDKQPIEPRQITNPLTSPARAVGAAAGELPQMKQTTPSVDASGATRAAAPAVTQPAGGEPQPAVANQVAAAPAPAATTGSNEGVIEQPPISFRSLSQPSYQTPLPALRIEHNRGPDDGLSEVSGRVTDASGALVSGATVSLRDAAGTTRQATTAADGTFNLTSVAAGKYDLSVTARGFESNRQSISLQPRDVAMLDSVLRVGASSETVTVTASAMTTLNTSEAEISSVLPSHMPAASSATNGKRVLSMDTAGALFLSRNGGKSWKKVKPVWAGKVTEVALATSPETSEPRSIDLKRKGEAASSSKAFQITTDSGAVWVSQDGTHWQAQ